MMEVLLGSAVFTAIVLALTATVSLTRRLLAPAREVVLTVNSDRRLVASGGGKLLFALGEAGIHIPSTCAGMGICGLCRVTVTGGGGPILPTELARLSRAEARRGVRLACQLLLREDLSLEIPAELLATRTWESTVASTRTLSPLIKEVVLDMPPGEDLEFRPGAFVQLTAPPFSLAYADIEVAPEHEAEWERYRLRALSVASNRPETRAYSIANTPAERGCVLYVRLALPPQGSREEIPPGLVSSYLFGVRPGDRITLSGPYGDFRVQAAGEGEMVFIGGGVGMAPLRAMIFDQLERVGTRRKITFWYGARSRLDLFNLQELDRLQERHPNFNWVPALSDPKPDDAWDGAVGFIHDVVRERYIASHPEPEACDYYLCGPPIMTSAVLAMLDDAGVDPDHIFRDDFGG